MIIAIDGPSGAGKGTVARRVAETLSCRHVDTGAMYRAVAWAALQRQIPLEDEGAIAAIARDAAIDADPQGVRIDGADVTTAIRTPAIDRAASSVARLPQVRAALVSRQRALAAAGHIVMEGRDIGTVVFPQADVKIYLDADPAERARRRAQDPAHQGQASTVAAVATAIQERDALDRTRTASPLAIAPDAVVIDTTPLSIDDVVTRVLAIVRDRAARA